jgi:hypothetical protein
LYNKDFEKDTKSKTKSKPIITNNSQSDYSDKARIIFLTVCTAEDELDPIKENHRYHVTQESKCGFLNVKIENDGNTLIGKFHTNDGKILDQFTLNDI